MERQPRKPKITALSVEQIQALVKAMPERDQTMVIVQRGLGLRLGELLALRAQDVDFLRRVVRIEEQMAELTRERVPLKTDDSKRSIPLPTHVAEALAAHIAEFPPAEDGTIFTKRNGLHYVKGNYSQRVF
jgi:integrase